MNKQSNQVRPRMSRENYEWLKSIDGETNDERVEKLKANEALLEAHSDEIEQMRLNDICSKNAIYFLNKSLDITGKEKIRMKSERDTFIAYLCVSMSVNFGLLGYIATLQGWF